MSVTAPVSLLTIMSDTRIVSSRSAARTCSGEMPPDLSGCRRVTEKPSFSRKSSVRRTASCSAAELMICRPCRRISRAPEISAQLSPSEPQEVK